MHINDNSANVNLNGSNATERGEKSNGHNEDLLAASQTKQNFVKKYLIDVVMGLIFVGFGIWLPYFIFNDEHASNQEFPGYYETIEFYGQYPDGTMVSNMTLKSLMYIQNPSNLRSFVSETAVSGTLLFVLDAVVPLTYVMIIICVFKYLLKWNGKYLYYEFVSFIYAYLAAMSLVFWLTRIVKYYCSWPRPDCWERCLPQFSWSSNDTFLSIQRFNEVDSCTYLDTDYLEESDFQKAFTSFPSGHTSYMFTAAIVLTYWTYGKLNHPSLTHEQRLSIKFDPKSRIGRLIGTKWIPPDVRDRLKYGTQSMVNLRDNNNNNKQHHHHKTKMNNNNDSNDSNNDNNISIHESDNEMAQLGVVGDIKNDLGLDSTHESLTHKQISTGSTDGSKRLEQATKEYRYVLDASWISGFILATWGLWGSMLVAISRIDDHRHFPVDLVGGALLAFCCASFGFLTQYDYGQPVSKRVLRIMQRDLKLKRKKENKKQKEKQQGQRQNQRQKQKQQRQKIQNNRNNNNNNTDNHNSNNNENNNSNIVTNTSNINNRNNDNNSSNNNNNNNYENTENQNNTNNYDKNNEDTEDYLHKQRKQKSNEI